MAIAENVLEIEVDGRCNESLHFRPLGRVIRGKFDFARDLDPQAMMMRSRFPQGYVPGQRLRVDLDTHEAFIIDKAAEHEATREAIERKGMKLPPASESVGKVDLPTWLYWMRRAIEAGLAAVTRGAFPHAIEGEPQKYFRSAPPEKSAIEQHTEALRENNALMREFLKRQK